MRRLLTTALAGAMFAAPLAVAPAQAAPNAPAYSAARWLDDQLTDGITTTSGYPDYGLSLDIFFTFKTLGTRAEAAASVIEAMETQQAFYTGGTYDPDGPGDCPTQTEVYAGATGKLATAVAVSGGDPTAFNGTDLIDQLEKLIDTDGADQGRAKDSSTNTDPACWFGDFSNSVGQSFAARALAGADSSFAADATSFLLKQQCTAGFFRTFLASADSTCNGGTAAESKPDVDATAYALQALRAIGGHQPAIDKGIAWLLSVQHADGSFESLGNANANSTALAAVVLADAGKTGAAGNAAAWLAQRQVTPELAEGTKLVNDLGAVAFDDKALAAGKKDGVTDQWRRSTSQAALGLNLLLPAKTLGVTAPTGFVKAGRNVTIGATGLVPGEKYTVTLSGVAVASGLVPASGNVSALVAVPAGTKDRAVAVTGSRTQRTGTAVLKALDKRTLGLRLKAVVAKGGKQTVRVTKLAPGEKVTLRFKGTKVATGFANTQGRFVAEVKVGRAKGTFLIKARGEFANRKAAKSFRVR